MKDIVLSVIIPTTDGVLPSCVDDLRNLDNVEVVTVSGVRPVGRARNIGLERSLGEYIAWVDSDDEVDQSWLPEILKAIETGSDIITFDAKLVGFPKGELIWGERDPNPHNLLTEVYHDVKRMSSMWLYVSKRSLWEGLRFDETLTVLEDFDLLPKLLKRARSVFYIRKKIYSYIKNTASLINTLDDDDQKQMFWIKQKRHREAGEFQAADRFVVGFAYYQLILRVHTGCASFVSQEWVDEARDGERWIRRNIIFLLYDVLFRLSLSCNQKWRYIARFSLSALGIVARCHKFRSKGF